MILDFNFKGKYVVIVGGGPEAYRKVLSFLDAKSKILVASRKFVVGIYTLHYQKKVDLMETDITDAAAFVDGLGGSFDVLVAVTNDKNLNSSLVSHAKNKGSMVYSVDNPAVNDFIFPAVAKLGDVRVAVSTSGKSPAMARVLRQRIEKMVTPEDLLQIKLQAFIRPVLKELIGNQKIRKVVLGEILDDRQIKKLVKKGRLEDAKGLALNIAKSYQDEKLAVAEA